MTFLRRKFDMQERSTSKNKSVASDAAKKAKKRRRLYFSTPVAVGEDDFKKFPATYEKVMMPNVKQQPHHGGQSTSDLKKKRFRRHRVDFKDKHVDRDPGNAACIHQNVTKQLDKSMLGYDWIAGMLDNEQQIEDLSDEFFKDISKFRRENHMACKTYLPLKGNRPESIHESHKLKQSRVFKKTEENQQSYCCSGSGSYMLDRRFDIVPIHGPYSDCPVCKSGQKNTNKDDYIRVSVPTISLAQPYKLRPHRRKSFDPSDSVSLASHCLAGWQHRNSDRLQISRNLNLQSHSRNITKPK